jgi:hypothetical protein
VPSICIPEHFLSGEEKNEGCGCMSVRHPLFFINDIVERLEDFEAEARARFNA